MGRAGFAVAVADLEAGAELEAVADELRSMGRKAVAVQADIGDITAHERLLDQAEAAIGPLTTLVNNAGVSVMSRATFST